MVVYDSKKKNILTEYDLEKGHLVEDIITVHVQEVKEQKIEDYVVDGVYTIVKPYIQAVEEHYEEQPIYRYVLYTEKELAEIEHKKYIEQLVKEMEESKQWLSSHDYIGVKIATGRATVEEYQEDIEEMKAKAVRINEIELILKGEEK